MGDLETFVTVVEAGGFTSAAHVLDISVTAVSRRLKALEGRLGTRLLNRTTRQVSLTAAGQLYYERVRHILDELREAEDQLSRLADEPRGVLRLTAPVSYGLRRLASPVARFAAIHPALQVQLLLDDRVVDLVEQRLDLALRVGDPEDSSLVARPILSVPRYLCASPGYLDDRGVPERPRDLLRHSCLHYSNIGTREEWTLRGPAGPEPIQVQGAFCSNNGEVLCEAAAEGLGIVLLPDFIVQDALARGRLTRVLRGFEPPPCILYALYPSRHFVPAKVRHFLAFLGGNLKGT